MADVKISDLSAASSLAGTDVLEIDTGAASKKISATNLATFVKTGVALTTDLTAHTGDTGNPHGVTVNQIGAQPVDATLTALAGVSTGADKVPYFTGTDAASLMTVTAAARTVLDDTTTAAMLTTLGAEPAITAGSSAQLLLGNKGLIAQTALPIPDLVQTELDALQAEIDGISVGAAAGVHVCTGVGDGVTNDYAALLAMFTATAEGEIAQLKPGKTYLSDSNIVVTRDTASLIFDGNGSKIVFSNPAHRLRITTAFVNVQTMGAMSSDGLSVGCTDSSVYRLNEDVRFYSNDSTTGAHQSTYYRCEDINLMWGESNVLYLTAPSLTKVGDPILLPTYTTSPKIAQRSGKTLLIKDLTVNHSEAAIAAWSSFSGSGMVQVEGFTRPVLMNVSSTRAALCTIMLVSNVNALVIGGFDGWHEDRNFDGIDSTSQAADKNTYGYGLLDYSKGTRVFGRSAQRVRHALDGGELYGLGTSTPMYYGTSVGARFIGCRAENTTEDAFTSHTSVRDMMFISCSAHNCGLLTNAGVNNTGYAFGARGDVSLVNCSDYNCFGGYHAFDEGAGDGGTPRTPSNARLRIYGSYTSEGSGPSLNSNHVTPVEIYGSYVAIDCKLDSQIAFYSGYDDTVTRFHGPVYIRPSLLSAGNAIFGPGTKGTFELEDWVLDLGNVTNKTTSYIFNLQGNGATTNTGIWHWKNLRILGAGASVLFKYNASNLPDANQIRGTISADDGVLTYSGSARNDNTNIQLCGSNNLAAKGDTTVINAIDRYKGGKRVETLTGLNFGATVLTMTGGNTTATINGFKSGQAIVWSASCTTAGVTVTSVTFSADNTATIYVTNSTTGTLNLASLTINIELMCA